MRWWSPKTPVGVVSSETLQGIRTLKRTCGMENVAVMRVLGVVKWVVLSEPIFALLDSKEMGGSRRPSPKSNVGTERGRNHLFRGSSRLSGGLLIGRGRGLRR